MTGRNDSGMTEFRVAWRRGRSLFAWAFVFSVFVNLLMLTGPLYMLAVYDQVLASQSVDMLVALTVLVSALYLLMAVLDYARGRLMARIGARFQTHLDGRLFDIVMRRSADPRARQANSRALRDLESLQTLFLSPVLIAVMDMPWTPLFVAAIFLFHPLLGWLAVTGGVMIVILTLVNQIVTAHRVRLAQIATQQAHTFADQTQAASETVLTQGMRGSMTSRYKLLRNDAQSQNVSANDRSGIFTSVTKSFRLFLQSAILGLGAYFVIRGELTPGAMIACSILLGRALAPIEQAMGNWPVLQRARAGRRSLVQLLSDMPDHGPETRLPRPRARLSVEGADILPPGAKTPVLRDLSFSIEPGQALGVIGPSGSGKSSLARVLTGFWPLASGQVRLDGATLDQYHADDLGRYIGYLPQTVSLFAGTVAENIRRMAPQGDSRQVIEAAKLANAHKMIMGLPKGYDTYLDGDDCALSGGQRQRIALARALYGDPVLLVLDEPNSMLDTEGSEALNRTVGQLRTLGKSVIIMTHRPQAIAQCDLLMVIENGVLSGIGPRDEMLEKTYPNIRRIRKLVTNRAGS
ncbi:type I secretion system permease/ATPase [Roseovarius sp. CAU 1744]|uniref:type I secretion system permease/ATPase n=1 Tax=Roseovarius sp. CAU 1744 TaxID=3140368 RepID=UPI00325A5A43